MKISILLLSLILLTGCVTSNGISHVDPKGWWSERTEGEKIVIGVGSAVILNGLIQRNGAGNNSQNQQQCISLKSLETGCIR